MSSLLSYALAAARRGWAVFPVVPGQKRAAVKAWEDRATTDPDRIRQCWATGDWNIGIAAGPSGLVVIDLDMPRQDEVNGVTGFDTFTELTMEHGESVPAETFCASTPSGGFHMYFRHPDDGPDLRNTAKQLARLIDTRAHGGYVLGPGSRLSTGGVYTAFPADVAPLPEWLAGLLRPAPPPEVAPVNIPAGTTRAGRYLEKAIAGAVDAIRSAGAIGDGRKTALFNAALTLGRLVAGGALNSHDTEQLLTSEASRVGVGPGVIRSTIASAFRYGAERPRSLTTS